MAGRGQQFGVQPQRPQIALVIQDDVGLQRRKWLVHEGLADAGFEVGGENFAVVAAAQHGQIAAMDRHGRARGLAQFGGAAGVVAVGVGQQDQGNVGRGEPLPGQRGEDLRRAAKKRATSSAQGIDHEVQGDAGRGAAARGVEHGHADGQGDQAVHHGPERIAQALHISRAHGAGLLRLGDGSLQDQQGRRARPVLSCAPLREEVGAVHEDQLEDHRVGQSKVDIGLAQRANAGQGVRRRVVGCLQAPTRVQPSRFTRSRRVISASLGFGGSSDKVGIWPAGS